MVGEQLKDICRGDPHCAKIVNEDLDSEEMSIVEAEKQIRKWADNNKKGNCAVVPPNVAENIIRKFYGLPEIGDEPQLSVIPFSSTKKKIGVLDLL